uniref:Uncharacterized protein n=1 Tax=Proboscia inermis TaxID=420281 RepID=A0A7S0GHN0_9STRA
MKETIFYAYCYIVKSETHTRGNMFFKGNRKPLLSDTHAHHLDVKSNERTTPIMVISLKTVKKSWSVSSDKKTGIQSVVNRLGGICETKYDSVRSKPRASIPSK